MSYVNKQRPPRELSALSQAERDELLVQARRYAIADDAPCCDGVPYRYGCPCEEMDAALVEMKRILRVGVPYVEEPKP